MNPVLSTILSQLADVGESSKLLTEDMWKIGIMDMGRQGITAVPFMIVYRNCLLNKMTQNLFEVKGNECSHFVVC